MTHTTLTSWEFRGTVFSPHNAFLLTQLSSSFYLVGSQIIVFVVLLSLFKMHAVKMHRNKDRVLKGLGFTVNIGKTRQK